MALDSLLITKRQAHKLEKVVSLLTLPTYDPNALLDFVKQTLHAETDIEMLYRLGFNDIQQAELSKIRTRKRPLGAVLLLQIHETTNIPIAELRSKMGDTRRRFA
ncbi:hypothetical protein [Undibacterium oligocarboniphilum]|uniref:Uncharacterized protein n=1 Tax=Undibacterium oligocarboniphilum TaxID=666702 RepID=A0A850QRD0_9BURK|nr:hypothetical protein [Undibacterium oligocarboniphilum]MBC3871490.1 hypothetical protein [Undibacterium oligocarboniphilum]NVO78934.1 hypothetical protein [Undibacterium oligocarboniphilum]